MNKISAYRLKQKYKNFDNKICRFSYFTLFINDDTVFDFVSSYDLINMSICRYLKHETIKDNMIRPVTFKSIRGKHRIGAATNLRSICINSARKESYINEF